MKVSVIIPYKKDRGWLKQAIASVPRDCELILSQGEGNCQQNFNNGILKSTGDLVRWLHEDDMLAPGSIEHTIKTFYEQDVDFIHGRAKNIGERNETWTPRYTHPTMAQQMTKNQLHGGTLVFRRDVFNRIGLFDETLVWSEEYEFTLRCLYHGLKIGYCNQMLYYYRRHPAQKSIADNQKRTENLNKIRSRYADYQSKG